MKDKKGISAIVATVMIILITVAAVAIVWTAVVPMIQNQLEAGTICLDASQLTLANKGYTCIENSGGDVSIQVQRGAKDFDLTDIQVLVSAGGSTNSYSVVDDVSGATLPGTNEERVYSISTGLSGDEIEEVQVAPIISTGVSEKTCDVSSKLTLKYC